MDNLKLNNYKLKINRMKEILNNNHFNIKVLLVNLLHQILCNNNNNKNYINNHHKKVMI